MALGHWLLKEYDQALSCLRDDKSNCESVFDPSALHYFHYLREHIMLRTIPAELKDDSDLVKRAVSCYINAGCPILALDMLPQLENAIPKKQEEVIIEPLPEKVDFTPVITPPKPVGTDDWFEDFISGGTKSPSPPLQVATTPVPVSSAPTNTNPSLYKQILAATRSRCALHLLVQVR